MILSYMSILSCNSYDLNYFSGEVTYDIQYESGDSPSRFNGAILGKMNKDKTNLRLLFDESNYKTEISSVNKALPVPVNVFISDSNKIYSYIKGQTNFCFWDYPYNNILNVSTSSTMDTVLGYNCKSVIITWKQGKTSEVFFTEELRIKGERILVPGAEFSNYFSATQCVPLKIITRGDKFSVIYKAKYIIKKEIDKSNFVVDDFKKMIKQKILSFSSGNSLQV
jgi:hypothetical protein